MSTGLGLDTAFEPLSDRTVVDTDVHLSISTLLPRVAEYMDEPYSRFIDPKTAYAPVPSPGWPKHMGGKRKFDLVSVETGEDIDLLCAELGVDVPIINTIAPVDAVFKTDVALELMRASNDLLAEEVLTHDDAFRGLVTIGARDPDAAVAEIERWADHDQVVGAYIMMGQGDQKPLGDPRYDEMWAAMEDAGLTPVLHVSNFYRQAGVLMDLENVFSTHALSTQWSAMLTVTSLIANGVPEKFPGLDFVVLEASLAWIPGTMAKLNREYGQWTQEVPLLEKTPEAYLRDRFYFGSQPIGEMADSRHMQQLLEMVGADSIVFATDYPHYDFDHPSALTNFLQGFDDDEQERILAGNAVDAFDLDL